MTFGFFLFSRGATDDRLTLGMIKFAYLDSEF